MISLSAPTQADDEEWVPETGEGGDQNSSSQQYRSQAYSMTSNGELTSTQFDEQASMYGSSKIEDSVILGASASMKELHLCTPTIPDTGPGSPLNLLDADTLPDDEDSPSASSKKISSTRAVERPDSTAAALSRTATNVPVGGAGVDEVRKHPTPRTKDSGDSKIYFDAEADEVDEGTVAVIASTQSEMFSNERESCPGKSKEAVIVSQDAEPCADRGLGASAAGKHHEGPSTRASTPSGGQRKRGGDDDDLDILDDLVLIESGAEDSGDDDSGSFEQDRGPGTHTRPCQSKSLVSLPDVPATNLMLDETPDPYTQAFATITPSATALDCEGGSNAGDHKPDIPDATPMNSMEKEDRLDGHSEDGKGSGKGAPTSSKAVSDEGEEKNDEAVMNLEKCTSSSEPSDVGERGSSSNKCKIDRKWADIPTSRGHDSVTGNIQHEKGSASLKQKPSSNLTHSESPRSVVSGPNGCTLKSGRLTHGDVIANFSAKSQDEGSVCSVKEADSQQTIDVDRSSRSHSAGAPLANDTDDPLVKASDASESMDLCVNATVRTPRVVSPSPLDLPEEEKQENPAGPTLPRSPSRANPSSQGISPSRGSPPSSAAKSPTRPTSQPRSHSHSPSLSQPRPTATPPIPSKSEGNTDVPSNNISKAGVDIRAADANPSKRLVDDTEDSQAVGNTQDGGSSDKHEYVPASEVNEDPMSSRNEPVPCSLEELLPAPNQDPAVTVSYPQDNALPHSETLACADTVVSPSLPATAFRPHSHSPQPNSRSSYHSPSGAHSRSPQPIGRPRSPQPQNTTSTSNRPSTPLCSGSPLGVISGDADKISACKLRSRVQQPMQQKISDAGASNEPQVKIAITPPTTTPHASPHASTVDRISQKAASGTVSLSSPRFISDQSMHYSEVSVTRVKDGTCVVHTFALQQVASLGEKETLFGEVVDIHREKLTGDVFVRVRLFVDARDLALAPQSQSTWLVNEVVSTNYFTILPVLALSSPVNIRICENDTEALPPSSVLPCRYAVNLTESQPFAASKLHWEVSELQAKLRHVRVALTPLLDAPLSEEREENFARAGRVENTHGQQLASKRSEKLEGQPHTVEVERRRRHRVPRVENSERQSRSEEIEVGQTPRTACVSNTEGKRCAVENTDEQHGQPVTKECENGLMRTPEKEKRGPSLSLSPEITVDLPGVDNAVDTREVAKQSVFDFIPPAAPSTKTGVRSSAARGGCDSRERPRQHRPLAGGLGWDELYSPPLAKHGRKGKTVDDGARALNVGDNLSRRGRAHVPRGEKSSSTRHDPDRRMLRLRKNACNGKTGNRENESEDGDYRRDEAHSPSSELSVARCLSFVGSDRGNMAKGRDKYKKDEAVETKELDGPKPVRFRKKLSSRDSDATSASESDKHSEVSDAAHRVRPSPKRVRKRARPRRAHDEEEEEEENEPTNLEPGMMVEAVDLKNPHLIAVASIVRMFRRGQEALVHFTGWGKEFDYRCLVASGNIAPPNTAASLGFSVLPPPKTKFKGKSFNWGSYLTRTNTTPAPEGPFKEVKKFFPAYQGPRPRSLPGAKKTSKPQTNKEKRPMRSKRARLLDDVSNEDSGNEDGDDVRCRKDPRGSARHDNKHEFTLRRRTYRDGGRNDVDDDDDSDNVDEVGKGRSKSCQRIRSGAVPCKRVRSNIDDDGGGGASDGNARYGRSNADRLSTRSVGRHHGTNSRYGRSHEKTFEVEDGDKRNGTGRDRRERASVSVQAKGRRRGGGEAGGADRTTGCYDGSRLGHTDPRRAHEQIRIPGSDDETDDGGNNGFADATRHRGRSLEGRVACKRARDDFFGGRRQLTRRECEWSSDSTDGERGCEEAISPKKRSRHSDGRDRIPTPLLNKTYSPRTAEYNELPPPPNGATGEKRRSSPHAGEAVEPEGQRRSSPRKRVSSMLGNSVSPATRVEGCRSSIFAGCKFSLTLPDVRSERGTKPLFSSACKDKEGLNEAIIRLKGVVIKDFDTLLSLLSPSSAAHDPSHVIVIAERPARTCKYLTALAVGMPVQSLAWLQECIEKRKWVDPRSYVLPAGYNPDHQVVPLPSHVALRDCPLPYAERVFWDVTILFAKNAHRENAEKLLRQAGGTLFPVASILRMIDQPGETDVLIKCDYVVTDVPTAYLTADAFPRGNEVLGLLRRELRAVSQVTYEWFYQCLIHQTLLRATKHVKYTPRPPKPDRKNAAA